jgi:hypothetical protein
MEDMIFKHIWICPFGHKFWEEIIKDENNFCPECHGDLTRKVSINMLELLKIKNSAR